MLADLDYAFEKLPATRTPDQKERVTKAAALALRGKVNLYWGSWNKYGWPELDTFTPDAVKAQQAFQEATNDFRKVIKDYGLTLYKNGSPGEIDDLGKAGKLPNYFHLFLPTSNADNETIIGFTHGGIGSGVSDKLMRDIGPRETESSEVNVSPNYWLADRYQSTTTGDFLPPMEQYSDRTQDAKYNPNAATLPNSALNPQTYLGRDYRMKATILWNGEVIQRLAGLSAEGLIPYHHGKQGNQPAGSPVPRYIDYNGGTNSGYLFRKFVRNYPGQGREQGDMTWPVIRLADVYLMYAEAANEDPARTYVDDAVTYVNKVRARGNLPGLKPEKYANRDAFFDAIEQERIVELVLEGHRAFDIRRWRKIEEIWGPPNGPGKFTTNTWGNNVTVYFQNKNERAYQQCYIFKIPQSEMVRNPKLRQNAPYL
ncbi:RagB/SusD family nutrient uptake outer membrane protein [Pseudoxanthomonas sp. SGD-10]|nr:RagB/SusD family nutrient uptake outer membrane protein [Pseudoxanthomonas sp. SGD-10]